MDDATKLAIFAAAGGTLHIDPLEGSQPPIRIRAAARTGRWVDAKTLVVERTISITHLDGRNLLLEAAAECIDALAPKCWVLQRAGLAPPTMAEITGE